ncbi:fumarate hydratase subunit alpha [Lebetimonas natsushimae]|uniref:Fumarate hydratase subunit alpha n=1 Tax=Lebetimonas natsushimae TaxID=1936991 RepID=A0A292YDC4_9BACT|nr:fumarate hydratase [Lebetimonas natsushimae]GAX87320.1 fumarate hydratase subunit alpha [Lebetimonas natsushimae]
MRVVKFDDIVKSVRDTIIYSTTHLAPDMLEALKKAYEEEKSEVSRAVLAQILENAVIAEKEWKPLCQDTGLAIYFVKVGEDVKVEGGTLREAIYEGTRRGYEEGYLRASTCDCFTRANLKDKVGYNLPPIIYFDIVPGDKIDIEFAAKGGGSENVSRATVLAPAAGKEGIKEFVKKVVSDAGPNPCPPLVVGVGIGGSFDMSAVMSKHALFRNIGTPNPDPELDAMEKELKEELNKLGIGAMGMGGTETVLAVHIETYENRMCHIASLPVAVNIQCHSSRHAHITI